jgi:branched-chain amino acid transport system substrate-binding protein
MVAFVATLAAACTGGTGGAGAALDDPAVVETVPVKIAFLYDESAPDSALVITPSLLGLQLAMSQAVEGGDLPVAPEVVALDTEGDVELAVELAGDVADDPTYVAAVIGPFWSEPEAVGDVLDDAGVTTFSISGLDPSLPTNGWSAWRRVVSVVSSEAAAMASAIRGSPRSFGGVCLVGDGSPASEVLDGLLAQRLGDRVRASLSLPDQAALGVVVDRIGRLGCDAVGWTGFGLGAIALRTGLAASGGASEVIVGSAAMKSDTYLVDTAGSGDGTIVTCACVDLGSSTRPEARRFIHDFQARFGSPPGVYAAEGWDVGGMLLRSFRAGSIDRRSVAARLATSAEYDGLANSYRFDEGGELARGAARVHRFRAEGLRWVPLGETDRDVPLPVGTPGTLAMSSCRKGPPFAYATNGRRLAGFDVELGRAVARRIGLTMIWRDLPCTAAIAAVANGILDAVLAPASRVPQGTPTSGIALSLHVALVTSRATAHGQQPILQSLGPGDVVSVVPTPEGLAWARDALPASGATRVVAADRAAAYRALVVGSVVAVADLEPRAWAAIERRPTLSVAQSLDAGAHDVFVGKGSDAMVVAAIDEALTRLIRTGRYAFLFAKYFPGTRLPSETGT